MPSVAEELEKMLNMDKIQLYKFLDQCVDELIGTTHITVKNFANDSEPTEGLNETRKYITSFFRNTITQEEFKPDPTLSTKVNEVIKTCFDVRREDIFQALAKECVLQKGYSLVENYDWKLKWILGSSDITTIREPVLQIDFHCVSKEDDKIKRNTVNFEANSGKVNELIQALTEIKKDLESL